jgi:hypothetical protein
MKKQLAVSIGRGVAVAGSGDVTAAAAFAVDNVIVRADGAVKGVQASGWVIADTDEISATLDGNEETGIDVTVSGDEAIGIKATASGPSGIALRGIASDVGGAGVSGSNTTAAGIGVIGTTDVTAGIGVVAQSTDAGGYPFAILNDGGFYARFASDATADRQFTIVDPATMGADLTNSVTSGGVNSTIADVPITMANADAGSDTVDIATTVRKAELDTCLGVIRDDIYQLARSLKVIQDTLRDMGILT